MIYNTDSDITIVITACGRPDLLKKTLISYYTYFNKPIYQFIVIEDSGTRCNDILEIDYPEITWIFNEVNLGQIKSIDKAYSIVTTKYIFHGEEDFLLLLNFNLDAQRIILETHSNVFTVVLSGHKKSWVNYGIGPILSDGTVLTAPQSTGFFWVSKYQHTFTFNPGLRRLSDYIVHGPYSNLVTFDRKNTYQSEFKLSLYHKKFGFVLAHANSEPMASHIGLGRHV